MLFKKVSRADFPLSERNGDTKVSSVFKNWEDPSGSEIASHMSLRRSSRGNSISASTNVESSGPALRRSRSFSSSEISAPDSAS
jgi:hypothetical protein